MTNTKYNKVYGFGHNGPGHCFHQHLTFFIRCFGRNGIPPAAAYSGYTLKWDSLWSAILGRRQIFDAAAEHFEVYVKKTNCFNLFGLNIQKIPFCENSFSHLIKTSKEKRELTLAAVDTYYLLILTLGTGPNMWGCTILKKI